MKMLQALDAGGLLTCWRTSTSVGDQLVAPLPMRMGTLGSTRTVSRVVGSSVHS